MRKIDRIIIHCSDTPAGRHTTVADIDRWHREKGYKKIGYHYVIYLNGAIHKGRSEMEVGAHCKGYNAHSIGICYVGGKENGKPKDTRTDAQKESLLFLLRDLKKRYPNAKICGHRDLAARDCPCFDAKSEYSSL